MAEGRGDDDRIRTRDELVDHLRFAAQLEHGLALQYLFAAFSLKSSPLEGGLSPAQLNTVRRWKAIVFRVASQEMLHLCQVVNLTIAVGGEVDFWLPNFPQQSNYTPMYLPWELSRYSDATLGRFCSYEQPQQVLDAFRVLGFINPVWLIQRTIGQLYGAIETAFRELDVLERPAPKAVQATGELVDFPQLKVVRSTQDACDAIDLIVRQGEAMRESADSHFETFSLLLEDYRREVAAAGRDSRPFDPVRGVANNPCSEAPSVPTPGLTIITDPYTRDVQRLNSAVYSVMMLMLSRFFSADEPLARRRAFSAAFLRLMTAVLVPLGEALARLPVGGDDPAATAGPSFELHPEIAAGPVGREGVPVFRERLEQAAREALELGRSPGAPLEIGHAAASLAAIVKDLEVAS